MVLVRFPLWPRTNHRSTFANSLEIPGPVNPDAIIRFAWTLGPVLIAKSLGLILLSIDFDTQRIQPWLSLAEGRASASKSLLLDYPGLFAPRRPIAALKNRHWLVLITSVNIHFMVSCNIADTDT